MNRLLKTTTACLLGLVLVLAGCDDDAGSGAATGNKATPPKITPPTQPAGGDTQKPANPDSAAAPASADKPKVIPDTTPEKAKGDKTNNQPAGKAKVIPKAKPAEKPKTDPAKKTKAKKTKAKGDKKGGDKTSKTPDTPDGPQSLYDQLRAVLVLANQGDFDHSLKKIDVVLARKDFGKIEPMKQRSILFITAQIAQALGGQHASKEKTAESHAAFLISAKHFRTLKSQFKELNDGEQGFGGRVFYNEACALAGKDAKAARASLTEAFEMGFDDFELLADDKDLEPLRKDPGFVKFVTAQKTVAGKRKSAALDKEFAKNKPFPFSFTLPNLEGKPVSLESFLGKVVIVDVWGTWCPPCRTEVPHFVELQKTYAKQGLQIIGINYERNNDPIPGIKAFSEQNGINYPCVIGDPATRDRIPNFRAFPTTLFIDKSGDVRLVAVGARPKEYLEAVVKKLLAEPAPAAKKPAAKKPAAKKPAAKKPAAKKPAAKKPAAKPSAKKKSAAGKPGS
ncbi:MAG: TlpA disulfide reductase family protein [Planctomycetaceae bacterium]|nr:TlpA disulfide reductase family protein [Planctomycetaceae bacterium]